MEREGAGYPEAGSGLFREGQPLQVSLSRRAPPSMAITMGGGRRKPVHVGLEVAPHGRIRSPWAWQRVFQKCTLHLLRVDRVTLS